MLSGKKSNFIKGEAMELSYKRHIEDPIIVISKKMATINKVLALRSTMKADEKIVFIGYVPLVVKKHSLEIKFSNFICWCKNKIIKKV